MEKAIISGATYCYEDGSKSLEVFETIYSDDLFDKQIFDDVESELESFYEKDTASQRFFIVGVTAEYIESGNGYDVIDVDILYGIQELASLSEVSNFISNNK